MFETRKRKIMTAEASETLAIAALQWMASDAEQIGRFLSITGLGPDTLREAAQDPRFLASVLDYVIANEADLLAFAVDQGVNPADVAQAAAILNRAGSAPQP